MKIFLLKNKFVFFLIGCALIGLFQMFFFELKWDNIDAFFPYRFYFERSIENGQFPLWNHTINLGYPAHGDPQGGVWYPFTWLTSLLFGYNFLTFNIEFWIHYLLAGIGMYQLGKTIQLSDHSSFAMGICYMFSGYMVGSSEIYPFIIGATWLPFIALSMIQLYRSLNFNSVGKLSVYVSLIFLGAYPAFLILSLYSLLIFFCFLAIKRRKELVKVLSMGSVFIGLVILLCGGYFYSLIEVFEHMSRSQPLIYNEFFYSTSFSFQSLISLLYPYSTTTLSTNFFMRDHPVMLNMYIGILALPIIFYYTLQVRSKIKYILWALIIFSLLAAVGNQTPIRYLLFKLVPGFDLFRHPAIFRVFTILGLIIAFGIGLDHFFKSTPTNSFVKKSYLVQLISLSLIGVFMFFIGENRFAEILDHVFYKSGFSHLELSDHIAIQSVFIVIILLMFYLVLLKNKKIKTYFIILLAADLIIATQFNMTSTIISEQTISECNQNLKEIIEKTPKQTKKELLKDISEKSWYVRPVGMWRNLSIFSGKTAYDGYNPFQLINFNELQRSPIFDTLLNRPIAFISPGLETRSQGNYEVVDSVIIGYNSFNINCNITNNKLLYLSQNHHPNWKAFVDGKEQKIIENNHGLISISLPKGTHQIMFKYESNWCIYLLIISLGSFLLLLVRAYFPKTLFLLINNFKGAK